MRVAQVQVNQRFLALQAGDILDAVVEHFQIFQGLIGQGGDIGDAVVRQDQHPQLLQRLDPVDIKNPVVPQIQRPELGGVLQHGHLIALQTLGVGLVQGGKGRRVRAAGVVGAGQLDRPYHLYALFGPAGAQIGQRFIFQAALVLRTKLNISKVRHLRHGFFQRGQGGDLHPRQLQPLQRSVVLRFFNRHHGRALGKYGQRGAQQQQAQQHRKRFFHWNANSFSILPSNSTTPACTLSINWQGAGGILQCGWLTGAFRPPYNEEKKKREAPPCALPCP